MNNFTLKAQEAIQSAHDIALDNNHQYVDIPHLTLALLEQEDGVVEALLKKMDVKINKIKEEIFELIKKLPTIKTTRDGGVADLYITVQLQKVLFEATREAKKLKDEFVSTEHIFLSILKTLSPSRDVLNKFGVNSENILKVLVEVRGTERVTTPEPESQYQALEKYTLNLTRLAHEGKFDPIVGREAEIRRVMQVLSRRTKNNPVLIGEAGVGKTAIVEGLAQRIAMQNIPESLKNKDIISLDLGALVAGTKFRGEFESRVKSVLKEIKKYGNYVLFIDELHTLIGAGGAEGAIDASNLLKPALARGELHCIGATTLKEYQRYIERDQALERRFQPVYIEEPSVEDTIAILRGIKEKYEIFHGIRITDEAILNAVKFSKRYITDRFLPDKAIDLIDEASSTLKMETESQPEVLENFKKQIEQLEIEKTSIKGTKKEDQSKRKKINGSLSILKKKADELENRWKKEKEYISSIKKLKEELGNLKKEAELASREGNLEKVAEIKYGKIPFTEKRIRDVQKELSKIQKDRRLLREEVTAEDIANVVSHWTGIPVNKMLEGESEKLSKMEKEIHQRFINQEEAVFSVANAIRRSRAGISEEDKPVASFIFLGPTGVGKTELARALAEFMFNDEKALIRLDMSEYMESHTVAKMIGSPPGYVGYEEGGQLTELIKHRPYSVILFDEAEKAHPDVLNILLQIMDNGRLTDAKGRTVNFKNTIIIMTSNIGSDLIYEHAKKKEIGFTSEIEEKDSAKNVEAKVKEHLRETLRPEFLNRIDEIIVFNALSEKEIKQIVDLQIKKVEKRLKEKEIKLVVTEEVKKKIADLGFDPHYGARPLKRVIQKQILDPLALKIVSGDIQEGDACRIIVENEKIIIK